jgi:hypothetical protein
MGKAVPKKPGKQEAPEDGERDLLVAYHEAGHAVMAWHRGVPAGRVTLL